MAALLTVPGGAGRLLRAAAHLHCRRRRRGAALPLPLVPPRVVLPPEAGLRRAQPSAAGQAAACEVRGVSEWVTRHNTDGCVPSPHHRFHCYTHTGTHTHLVASRRVLQHCAQSRASGSASCSSPAGTWHLNPTQGGVPPRCLALKLGAAGVECLSKLSKTNET